MFNLTLPPITYFMQLIKGGLPQSSVMYKQTCSLTKAGYFVASYNASTGGCSAIAATPPTAYSLDAVATPQVLYVTFTGGAQGRSAVMKVTCAPNLVTPLPVSVSISGSVYVSML